MECIRPASKEMALQQFQISSHTDNTGIPRATSNSRRAMHNHSKSNHMYTLISYCSVYGPAYRSLMLKSCENHASRGGGSQLTVARALGTYIIYNLTKLQLYPYILQQEP